MTDRKASFPTRRSEPLTQILYRDLYGKLEAILSATTEYQDADEACAEAASWVSEIQVHAKTGLRMIEDEMNALVVECDRLHAALSEYGQHHHGCNQGVDPRYGCKCGWAETQDTLEGR